MDEFNYLALTLETNLTEKMHVNKIANKYSQTADVLNKLKHMLPLRHKNTFIPFTDCYTIL